MRVLNPNPAAAIDYLPFNREDNVIILISPLTPDFGDHMNLTYNLHNCT